MTIFDSKAPGIMRGLMKDLSIDTASAAAILGNLGHESGGFRFLQEKKPLVKNSKGGYGWAQWTGPRRKSFEAYCDAQGLDPASDAANYGYLVLELRGSEKGAISALKKARSLDAKVKAFEANFERADPKYKHYPERLSWAERALRLYNAEISEQGASAVGDVAPPPLTPAMIGRIQERLKDLGYVEVGYVDEKLGNRTYAAVAAFRRDNALPLKDDAHAIDSAFVQKLQLPDSQVTRFVDTTRATMPKAEIAKTSTTLKTSWWARMATALGLGGGVTLNAAKDAISPDQVDEHLSVAGRLLHFVGDNWIMLLAVAATGAGIYTAFLVVEHLRVKAEREGRHFA